MIPLLARGSLEPFTSILKIVSAGYRRERGTNVALIELATKQQREGGKEGGREEGGREEGGREGGGREGGREGERGILPSLGLNFS